MKEKSNFLCPPGLSDRWIERFRILDFVIGINGYLHSPKKWNDEWDDQTKALWLRSIGMSPQNISEKLSIKLTTIKNRWIDNITRNYNLKIPGPHDWSNQGYVDDRMRHHIYHGGVPIISDDDHEIVVRCEMDGELTQIVSDYINPDPDTDTEPELDPSEKLYREWYINDND